MSGRTCSWEEPEEPPDWLGSEEQDWSSRVRSPEEEAVRGEVEEEETEDLEVTAEEEGEDSREDSRECCRSEMELGRGRSRASRLDFCRINLGGGGNEEG